MRILLTQHCALGTIGGTQTYNETLSSELRRRGHGVVLQAGEKIGPFRWGGKTEPFRADVAFVSQHTNFERARKWADKTIFISHGITDLDCPGHAYGADAYVAVSEEVAEHWNWPGLGKRSPHIIRQPIDTEFWSPGNHAQGSRYDVLRVSYYRGLEWLPALCAEMGLSFHHVKDERNRQTLRSLMRNAGVVIASGRSALEAQACDTPVVIADGRGYMKPMINYATGNDRRTNYSGRSGNPLTPDRMESMINEMMHVADVWDHRKYIVKHHDARKITDQLLATVEGA